MGSRVTSTPAKIMAVSEMPGSLDLSTSAGRWWSCRYTWSFSGPTPLQHTHTQPCTWSWTLHTEYLTPNFTQSPARPETLHTALACTWPWTLRTVYLTLNSIHIPVFDTKRTWPWTLHTVYLTLNSTHSPVSDTDLYAQPCTWPRTLHTELYLTLNSIHSPYLTLNSAHSPVPDPDLYIQPVPNPELYMQNCTWPRTHRIVPDPELYTQCTWPGTLHTALYLTWLLPTAQYLTRNSTHSPYLSLNRRNLYNIMTVWLIFLKF